MPDTPYVRGLHELGGHTYAWTEPDGSWGFSNAGLVVGDGESLLVDTLFDLPMTRAMLEGMASLTKDNPIKYVFITHGNGDHWFGNELVADAEIISTRACAEEMKEAGPAALVALRKVEGPVGDFARDVFGVFEWEGENTITETLPTRTFEGELTLDVGGIEVELVQVGPAHTNGDAVAWVPSAGTLFAGDMLFINGTPIAWAGPVQNWIDACDYFVGLRARQIVPGHGPVTDDEGVRAVQRYLQYVQDESTRLFKEGVPPLEAARKIDLKEFGQLHEKGRIVQNVLNVYRALDPSTPAVDTATILANIADIQGYGAHAC